MNKTATWTTALATLVCAGSAQAHHSGFAYQTTPLWIEGSVVSFKHENPHTKIMLEERSADGQVRLWAVEGPGQTEIDRMGAKLHVPEVGDRLKICGFPYKSAEDLIAHLAGSRLDAAAVPVDRGLVAAIRRRARVGDFGRK